MLRAIPFTAKELIFLTPTFFMALAFTIFSDRFGKLGIPISLPSSFGAIPNFRPQIFPMEIYLLLTGLLAIWRVREWPGRAALTLPFLATLFLFFFTIARALPDLAANPILVVRNSAFGWYLLLPIAIALYPMSSEKWERFFRILYAVVFTWFTLNLLYPFWAKDPGKIFWSIDLGLLLALAYGLCGAAGWKPRFTLGALGFALGLSLLSQVQRTTLLGLTGTIALLGLSYLLPVPRPAPHWKRLGWIAGGIALAVIGVSVMKALDRPDAKITAAVAEAAPMRISENLAPGVEKFRYYMWQDAWHLFVSAPAIGIGFLKPVVFRAYAGAGQFLDNEGSFEGRSQFRAEKITPPISGPHNSYLNAIARLGLAGSILLALHLACVWTFARRGYYACLFVLLWQMLYAFFNVSFEGPIRSFPILVLLGVALKASQEASLRIREDA